MRSTTIWKESLALLSLRFILAQLGLVAGTLAFFVLWLRLPDASVFEVASSGLLAVLVVAAACVGESRLILRLVGRPLTRGGLVRGALFLLMGAALWFAWSAGVAHLSLHDPLRAGYLNSQAPHQLRHWLTFEHVLLVLEWFWNAIRWIGTGCIGALVFPLLAGQRPLRAALAILRSPSFWLVLVVGTTAATLLTGALLAWRPLHGLWPEMASLVLRLTVAALLDATMACWLLTTLAVCVRRANPTLSR